MSSGQSDWAQGSAEAASRWEAAERATRKTYFFVLHIHDRSVHINSPADCAPVGF